MNDLYYSTSQAIKQYQNLKNCKPSELKMDDLFIEYPECELDENGILHLYVRNMLLNDCSKLDQCMGNTSYKCLIECIDENINNTKGVLLHVDSPGGKVAGLSDLAIVLDSLNVPVVAHIDSIGCSAGYYLACTSDYVFVGTSAITGSIGTILQIQDNSAQLEMLGIKTYCITNEQATIKDGDLEKPEVLDFYQSFVNKLGNQFIQWVKEHRPNVSQDVFNAGFWLPSDAINMGLVDCIGFEDDAEAYLMDLIANSNADFVTEMTK